MAYRATGGLVLASLLAVPALASGSGQPAAPGKKTTAEWIAQLKAGRTPEARVEAAKSLCDFLAEKKDLTGVKPLIVALSDPDARVRYASVDALSCLGDQRAVSPLIAVTLHDKNPRVREEAVEVLGGSFFSPNAESITALMAALKDRNAFVRSAAARGLNQKEDPQALGALVEALRDPDPAVRGSVARALGQLKDPRAADALVGALKDPEPLARVGAIRAMGDLEDRRAIGPMRAALKDPDAGVRMAAADGLGIMKDAASVKDLRTLTSDPDPWVRWRAGRALSEMGLGEAPDPPRGSPPREIRNPTFPPDDGGPGGALSAAPSPVA